MELSYLSSIAALILAIVAVVKAFQESKKIDKDTSLANAEAITAYEKAANLAAERALKLTSRISDLEDLVSKQGKKIFELEQLLADVQDLAERLAYQVQSLGGIPVKIRVHKSNEESEPKNSKQ